MAATAVFIDNPNLLWQFRSSAQSSEVCVSPAAVFLLLQATAFTGGIPDLLRHTGIVVKVVLVILALFSFVSWAIILYKGVSLRRAYSQSVTFLDVFRRSSKFSEVNSVCVQLKSSPLVGVFQAGYTEVNQQVVDNPTLINSDPAGAGWLFKLRIADRSQLDGLMDEPAYRALIADAP